MRRSLVFVVALTGPLCLAACGSRGSKGLTAAPSSPSPTTSAAASTVFDASGFPATPRVDNAWFPFLPGSVWKYTGVKDGEASREVMTVSKATKLVDGVHA